MHLEKEIEIEDVNVSSDEVFREIIINKSFSSQLQQKYSSVMKKIQTII